MTPAADPDASLIVALSPVLLAIVTAVVEVEVDKFVVVVTEFVETAVTNHLASTVIDGIAVAEP